jgi:hypothetical protein
MFQTILIIVLTLSQIITAAIIFYFVRKEIKQNALKKAQLQKIAEREARLQWHVARVNEIIALSVNLSQQIKAASNTNNPQNPKILSRMKNLHLETENKMFEYLEEALEEGFDLELSIKDAETGKIKSILASEFLRQNFQKRGQGYLTTEYGCFVFNDTPSRYNN